MTTKFVAIHNYKQSPDQNDEISLTKDKKYILISASQDWPTIKCEETGESGKAPKNYLKEIVDVEEKKDVDNDKKTENVKDVIKKDKSEVFTTNIEPTSTVVTLPDENTAAYEAQLTTLIRSVSNIAERTFSTVTMPAATLTIVQDSASGFNRPFADSGKRIEIANSTSHKIDKNANSLFVHLLVSASMSDREKEVFKHTDPNQKSISISNIIGSSGFFSEAKKAGIDAYVAGDWEGPASQKHTESQKYQSENKISVQDQYWFVENDEADLIMKVEESKDHDDVSSDKTINRSPSRFITAGEQNSLQKSVSVLVSGYEAKSLSKTFKVYLSSGNSSNTPSAVERTFTEFHWLRAFLVKKFKFIILPDLPNPKTFANATVGFHVYLNTWAKVIMKHPIVRNAHVIKKFTSLNHHDFKLYRIDLTKHDKITGVESFTKVSVNKETLHTTDLDLVCANTIRIIKKRQEAYLKVLDVFSKKFEQASLYKRKQLVTCNDISNSSKDWSRDLQEFKIFGAAAIGSAMETLSKGFHTMAQSGYKYRIMTEAVTRNFCPLVDIVNHLTGHVTIINQLMLKWRVIQAKHLDKTLAHNPYNMCKIRMGNILAIYQAEINLQIKELNKALTRGLTELIEQMTMLQQQNLDEMNSIVGALEELDFNQDI